MINNKIFTYVGFSMRAGKLKTGVNAIKTVKKGIYLIIVCNTASANSVKEAEKLSSRFYCPLYQTVTFTVEELVDKENCKVIAILEQELAKAIIKNAGEDLKEFSGGNE